MSHHLSTSLSASAASALHVLGGHVRAFAPSPRVVLGTAALASVGVLGIAGVGVASSDASVATFPPGSGEAWLLAAPWASEV